MKKILIIFIVSSFCIPVYADFLLVPWSTPSHVPHTIEKPRHSSKSQKIQKEKIQNTPAPTYEMIYRWSAIEAYQDRENGIFVQKISIASGARIEPFFEFHSYDTMTGEPLYRKFSPRDILSSLEHPPTSFINGQFFDPKRKNTPLSFAFKYKNTLLTAWADNRDEEKNIFSYQKWRGATILPYSWETLRDIESDFAIVNLSMTEPHEEDAYIGRTYMCLPSVWADGYSQVVFTLNFLHATEAYARDILHSWWCQDMYTSKLDSSGSSVFGIRQDLWYGYARRWSPDHRKLPQIIGFYE